MPAVVSKLVYFNDLFGMHGIKPNTESKNVRKKYKFYAVFKMGSFPYWV